MSVKERDDGMVVLAGPKMLGNRNRLSAIDATPTVVAPPPPTNRNQPPRWTRKKDEGFCVVWLLFIEPMDRRA